MFSTKLSETYQLLERKPSVAPSRHQGATHIYTRNRKAQMQPKKGKPTFYKKRHSRETKDTVWIKKDAAKAKGIIKTEVNKAIAAVQTKNNAQIRAMSRKTLHGLLDDRNVDKSHKTDVRELMSALKSRGLAQKPNSSNNLKENRIANYGIQSSGQSIATTLGAGLNSYPPTSAFETSLTTPGVLDSPFIDESHICPAPHGIIRGQGGAQMTNSQHSVLFLSPALASCVSSSLTLQRTGASLKSIADTYTFTLDDFTGVDGSWVLDFGNTTSAKKVFAWSGRVEAVIIAPGAVIQGLSYHGNAPASVILGTTVLDLIRMSTEVRGEKPGETYIAKSSIVERGMAHAPYGTFTSSTLPQDERVSWIIWSPSTVGSISGGAPAYFDIRYMMHFNYFWVPTYQPQVTSSTEAAVKLEALQTITAKQQQDVNNVVQRECVEESFDFDDDGITYFEDSVTIRNGHSMTYKHPLIQKRNNRRRMLLAGKTPRNVVSMAQDQFAPLTALPRYYSPIKDLDYVTTNVVTRWGDFVGFPAGVQTRLNGLVSAISLLRNSFDSATSIAQEYDDDVMEGSVSVKTLGGKLHFIKTTASGLTFDDYYSRIFEDPAIEAAPIALPKKK